MAQAGVDDQLHGKTADEEGQVDGEEPTAAYQPRERGAVGCVRGAHESIDRRDLRRLSIDGSMPTTNIKIFMTTVMINLSLKIFCSRG